MHQLEEADTYKELDCYYCITFPTIIPPCTSLNITPLEPRLSGPVELPMLMDSEKPCKKKSTSKKGPWCFKCNQYRHKCNMCMSQARRKVVYPSISTPEEDVWVEVKISNMTLLEHIALLDRQEWTPPSCSRCGKVNANHNKLECSKYEKCDCCGNTGSFGYVK
jgi:hypothetical protein